RNSSVRIAAASANQVDCHRWSMMASLIGLLLPSLSLAGELLQRVFGFVHILQRESTGFDQMGHEWLHPRAEQTEQLIDKPSLRGPTGDRRLEHVGIADLLCTPQRLLALEAVHHRLNRRVGGPGSLRKALLDLAHRAGTELPEPFHDLQLELRQPGC